MFTYFQHGRRHHPKHGTDPIDGAGVENHFVQAAGGLTLANDTGAPSSPTHVGVPVSISRQTVGSEDLYLIRTGVIDSLVIGDQGTYTVKAFASFPEGLSNYISVDAAISGDAYLYVAVAPSYVPASYSGVGGGFMVWEQSLEVLSTAVVGTATEVAVHPTVWQNSGSSRVVSAWIQVLRHT